MNGRSFKELFDEAERHPEFYKELAIIEFTEELSRVMREQRVTATELGRRIGASQAYISRVLNGGANFTLGSMTKLAMALGKELKIHLAPVRMVTTWHDHAPAARTTTAGGSVIEVDFAEPAHKHPRFLTAASTPLASLAIGNEGVSDGRPTSAA